MNCSKEFKIEVCVISLVMLFLVLPFLLFGKDCIVTIHDNLDSNIPWFKYIRDNNYFFEINKKSSTLDNLSSLYFAGDFTYKSFIYYFFDDFIAYTIVYVSSVLFSFISMCLFLQALFNKHKTHFVVMFVSLMYAALPTFPGYRIAFATLPVALLSFYYIYNKQLTYLQCIVFSILYPFFSSFESVLIFILGYWILLTIILSIKEKRLNFRLVLTFLVMCASTVLVNLRLFALRFVYNEPLCKEMSNNQALDVTKIVSNIYKTFCVYFVKGYYHSYSLQQYLILPIAIITLIYVFYNLINKNDTIFFKINKYLKIAIVCISIIFINCIIIVLNDISVLYYILRILIPPLAGLSFARLFIFNNVLWYVLFASALLYIYDKNIKFNRLIIIVLIIVQLSIIIFSNNFYQDSWKSWKHNILKENANISYGEFFSTNLFDTIKKDIRYNGEVSVAVGYHPSVLMYNGFNTADGYISVYPLKDALMFKKLIQPELDVNNEANHYYTSWPGRRYIFNKGIKYEPTKIPYYDSIELRINMEFFKNHYNGVYILSRARINNFDKLNIEFVKKYMPKSSIYQLYVYKTKY